MSFTETVNCRNCSQMCSVYNCSTQYSTEQFW